MASSRLLFALLLGLVALSYVRAGQFAAHMNNSPVSRYVSWVDVPRIGPSRQRRFINFNALRSWVPERGVFVAAPASRVIEREPSEEIEEENEAERAKLKLLCLMNLRSTQLCH